MSCFFSCAITNIGHFVLALKSTSHTVINTLWFTPVFLQRIGKNKQFTKMGNLQDSNTSEAGLFPFFPLHVMTRF